MTDSPITLDSALAWLAEQRMYVLTFDTATQRGIHTM